jgi:hypothetical protein
MNKKVKEKFDLIEYCVVRILMLALLLLGVYALIAHALQAIH